MLLQMAMDGAADGLTIAEFKEFISNIYDSVDIVEFGTSCVYRFGMEGVQEIKQAFPDKLILADMKMHGWRRPYVQDGLLLWGRYCDCPGSI